MILSSWLIKLYIYKEREQIEQDVISRKEAGEFRNRILRISTAKGHGTIFVIDKNTTHYTLLTALHLFGNNDTCVLYTCEKNPIYLGEARVRERHKDTDLAVVYCEKGQIDALGIELEPIPMVVNFEPGDLAFFVSGLHWDKQPMAFFPGSMNEPIGVSSGFIFSSETNPNEIIAIRSTNNFGMSGCPWLVKRSNKWYWVAVNSRSSNDISYGRRLDKIERLNFLQYPEKLKNI